MMENKCKHDKAYFFHENTPRYCPDCGEYLDGVKVVNKNKNKK